MKKINLAAGLLILLTFITPCLAGEVIFDETFTDDLTYDYHVTKTNYEALSSKPDVFDRVKIHPVQNFKGNKVTIIETIINKQYGDMDSIGGDYVDIYYIGTNPEGSLNVHCGDGYFGYFKYSAYGSGYTKLYLHSDNFTIPLSVSDGHGVFKLVPKTKTMEETFGSGTAKREYVSYDYSAPVGGFVYRSAGNKLLAKSVNSLYVSSTWKNRVIVTEQTNTYNVSLLRYGYTGQIVISSDNQILDNDIGSYNRTNFYGKFLAPLEVGLRNSLSLNWFNRTIGADDPGDTAAVTINIRDARNSDLIPNSHITIKNMITGQTVVNQPLPTGTGIFQLPKDTGFTLHQYLISASGGENYQDRGVFARVTGDMTINLDLQYIGDEAIDPTNNTLLHVYVIDEGKGPASTAIVQVGELARLTGLDGKATFELPKNTQQSYTISKDGYTPVSGNVDIGTDIETLNINIYRVTDKAAVTFQIRDARTGALIAGSTLQVKDVDADEILVNETLSSGRGTYYLPKDPGYNPSQYLVSASGGDDYQDRGVFLRVTGSATINVDLQYIGIDVDDPTNNTLLHVYVWNTDSNGPSSSTYVQVGSVARITNIEGYARFEVPKNSTQSYTVSRSGFSTVTGTVAIGTDPVVLNVDIARYVAPTPTPGPTQPPGVPGVPGDPSVPQDHREAAAATLRQAYAIVPQMFMLVLVLLLFAMIKRGMK